MPRHIRNILIASLLAILALAAGINGYIHHQFKTNIDNSLSSVQPFMQVKYSDLSTSIFSGKVELKNVRISAPFIPETLTLGDVTFETPGFAYMLQGPENIKKGVFPSSFGFSIDDFYLDLHGETAEFLDRLVNRMQPIYSNERKICGGKSLFGPADYKEMGYTRLLSSMNINYDFNEAKKTLDIALSAGTRNMGQLNATINIVNLNSMDTDKAMQGRMPRLEKAEFTYNDKSYTPHIIKYCSALDKTEKEEFVDAEIKQSDKYFYMAWGFAPGPGLREAYKDFLLKPDEVKITMTPGKEFNPMIISSMHNDEIVKALNVKLTINQLLIEDLSFKMPPPEFTKRFELQRAKSLDLTSLLRGEPVKAPVIVEKPKVYVKQPAKYHKISLKNISKHVSDYVRITTKAGSLRKGQLLRVTKANLYVQKKVSGGKFTMTVPRSKVKTIEAYFSK